MDGRRRLLGFYAKTPVFQGANEREIGLLLKLAAVTWVRDALDLRTPGVTISEAEIRGIIADTRHDVTAKAIASSCLSDATINDLAKRGVSPETRDVYNRIRDFITAAAKELAEREYAELDNQIAFHQGATDEERRAERLRDEAAVQDGGEPGREAA